MELHFIQDSKFLNTFIEQNERLSSSSNEYIYLHSKILGKRSLKNILSPKAKTVSVYSKSYYILLNSLNSYSKIFIHFLSDEIIKLLCKKNIQIKIYWIFWGADFYTPYSFFEKELYDIQTKKYFDLYGTFITTDSKLINFLKSIKQKLINKYSVEKWQIDRKYDAIKKIDYFLHYNVKDFEIFKKYFPCKAKFIPFFYYEFEYNKIIIPSLRETKEYKSKFNYKRAKVILLGNSASLSNNHLSALDYLSVLHDKDIQIVCPLSYGDLKYAKFVEKYGTSIFGDKFTAINTFMPSNVYLKFLSSVDIVIMNHKRSEGAGNIFVLLCLGKKVYLREENSLFSFSLENNLKVFSLNSLELENLFTPLDLITQEKNKKIAGDLFSTNSAEKKLLEIKNIEFR